MARQTSTAYSLGLAVNNYTSLPKAVRLMLERKYNEIENALNLDIKAREADRDALIAKLTLTDGAAEYATMKGELDALVSKINARFTVDCRVSTWTGGTVRYRLDGDAATWAQRYTEQCNKDVIDLRAAAKVRAQALAAFATTLVEQREELIIRTVKAAFSPEQNATLNDI